MEQVKARSAQDALAQQQLLVLKEEKENHAREEQLTAQSAKARGDVKRYEELITKSQIDLRTAQQAQNTAIALRASDQSAALTQGVADLASQQNHTSQQLSELQAKYDALLKSNESLKQASARSVTPPLKTPNPEASPAVNRSPSVNITGGIIPGHRISYTEPVYPSAARAAHVSGKVVLHGTIFTDGTIGDLQVVSGADMLRSAALEAVKKWRWTPYLKDGLPVEVDTTITVTFSIGK